MVIPQSWYKAINNHGHAIPLLDGQNTISAQTTLAGIATSTVTVTSDYAVTSTDTLILADTSSSSITITLPANPVSTPIYSIKKISASNTLTIDGNGHTIDGAGNVVVSTNEVNTEVQFSDGQWRILSTSSSPTPSNGNSHIPGIVQMYNQDAAVLTATSVTATGNNVLHFSAVPGTVVSGLFVADVSNDVIPLGTKVLSTTINSVTISNNVTGAGVFIGDTINFNSWNVLQPDGTAISISSSTTCGLQEAINYAQAHHCHLHVYGRKAITAVTTGGGATYEMTAPIPANFPIVCSSPLLVGYALNWDFRMFGALVVFTSAVTAPCMSFDTLINSALIFDAVFVSYASGATGGASRATALTTSIIYFNPLLNYSQSNEINIREIWNLGNNVGPCVGFNIAVWGMIHSSFKYSYFFGGNTSYNCVYINNNDISRPGVSFFAHCTTTFNKLNSYSESALRIGEAGASLIVNNYWQGMVENSKNGTFAGVAMYGTDEFMIINSSNNGWSSAYNVYDGAGTNIFIATQLNGGATPYASVGGSTMIYSGAGIIGAYHP